MPFLQLPFAVKVWTERSGVFPREDYRELLELVTHILSGTIVRKSVRDNNAPPKVVEFKMERPGAFHHARFMAKSIYYLKMFMLTTQLLNRALITHLEANQIEKMATFIILMHAKYFLQTSLTTAAPRLDLEFWSNANGYSQVNDDISNAVMQSVHRQMFYLAEETVLFSLCDDDTPCYEKKQLVEALLECDRPQTFPPMKPAFKVDKLLGKPHDEPKLKDFVRTRSRVLIKPAPSVCQSVSLSVCP